ncbi:hypothetical protein D3C87_55040 [compost metagenome]
MVTAFLEKHEWKEPRLVFTVPLPAREPVFMSMNVTDYGKKNFGIVIVDAQKFLRLWRAERRKTYREGANGTPKTWPNDYKYHGAAKGFSHGRENPVPLAHISFLPLSQPSVICKLLNLVRPERQNQSHYIAFSDGITRTIWLLTQGCVAFPVKCGMSSALQLFEAAGAEGTSFHSLADLIEITTAHQ